MILFRTRRILSPSYFPKSTTLAAPPPLFRFSTSSSSPSSSVSSPTPKPESNSNLFIKDYLITTCYLSPQKADRASKLLAHLSSREKPDSVRQFLKHQIGFSDASIICIISTYPHILTADAEKTIQPNLHSLRLMGFSDADIRKFIPRNVRALFSPLSIPRIQFWKSFLNNDMKKLVSALTTNRGLICQNDDAVAHKVAFLKGRGLSDADLRRIVVMCGGFFANTISSMGVLLDNAQQLGFQPGSGMFVHGIHSLTCLSSDTISAKMDIFKGLGWSEGDINSATEKLPQLLCLSEGNIREKMRFLVDIVGCTQGYIARHPHLLAFSLEKRLMPRFQVMKILKSSGLFMRELELSTIMNFSETTFEEKFVLRHKKVAPNLHEIYIAACKGQRILNVDEMTDS